MNKIKLLITSFFCLLILINSFTSVADSNNILFSNDYTYDPPVIQLIYPKGGEKLNDTIKIKWIAYHSDNTYEHLKINIYFRMKNSETWMEIINQYPNIGEYDWNTNNLLDENYFIRILAIDGDNNIGIATSEEFNLNNGNIKLEISNIIIMDNTINSLDWVKNCDNITIHAVINGLGAEHILKNNISADLTGFNLGKNVNPTSYDGKNAIWKLYYVKCAEGKDKIKVNINVNDDIHKNCTINIDNERPKLLLKKPINGIYLYNKKLFIPIDKTIIFGKIDIELEANDNSIIDRLEFFIDGKIEFTLHDSFNKFKFNSRLIGRHFIEIRLYDIAGNMISEKMSISIYNLI